jgi:osmoprotectant transport system ATP-binding protein
VLELVGVSKRYGDRTVLAPTSLVCEAGRTTVLLGPSGCGKSTLLRLAIGLVAPDTGEIRVLGERLEPRSLGALRRRMGYVIQDGGLFPHLDAAHNATLMARFIGWESERIAGRLGELAALTHFPAEALDRFPRELSGGQRQRVSLMRALMLDPELVLLDEPLGALDPLVRAELQRELCEIFARLGKTVVMVTHDMAEAAYFGHRLVLMREGAVVQIGAPRDLVERPADAFVTRFLQAQRGFVATEIGDGVAEGAA